MIKSISRVLICVSLIFLMACKEDRPDMSGLLNTVPSSAAGVIGLNFKSMAEATGSKISGNEIKPGKEVSRLIDQMKSDEKKYLLSILDGSTGIVPEYAIIFMDANRTFLTVGLYDVEKFKEFVKKDKDGMEFSDQGSGVQTCENIAIRGNQAWMCLSSAKKIDPDAIVAYSALSRSQSFLSTDMSKVILDSDDDIVGWGNFNTMLTNMLGRKDMSMISIASGILFEDAEAVAFCVEFEKGEMEIEASFLNDKGKPAKYLLPAEKIDTKVLDELGSSCDAILAFTVTPKLIKKLDKVGSALGGGLLGDLNETFKNVDGTIGVAFGNSNQNINGVVTTKGEINPQLSTLLSFVMDKVLQDGKIFRFSRGSVSGGMQVSECASLLKGYTIAAAGNLESLGSSVSSFGDPSSNIKTVVIGLAPEGGSLKFKMDLQSTQPDENFLLTLLKSLK